MLVEEFFAIGMLVSNLFYLETVFIYFLFNQAQYKYNDITHNTYNKIHTAYIVSIHYHKIHQQLLIYSTKRLQIMDSLKGRRIEQCNKFFESIVSNPEHKLHHFLPPKNNCSYNLRRQRQFANPLTHTKRFSSTFLPSMCRR